MISFGLLFCKTVRMAGEKNALNAFGINKKAARRVRTAFSMERIMGIEPTSTAWEAVVLPMNYIRVANNIAQAPERIKQKFEKTIVNYRRFVVGCVCKAPKKRRRPH